MRERSVVIFVAFLWIVFSCPYKEPEYTHLSNLRLSNDPQYVLVSATIYNNINNSKSLVEKKIDINTFEISDINDNHLSIDSKTFKTETVKNYILYKDYWLGGDYILIDESDFNEKISIKLSGTPLSYGTSNYCYIISLNKSNKFQLHRIDLKNTLFHDIIEIQNNNSYISNNDEFLQLMIYENNILGIPIQSPNNNNSDDNSNNNDNCFNFYLYKYDFNTEVFCYLDRFDVQGTYDFRINKLISLGYDSFGITIKIIDINQTISNNNNKCIFDIKKYSYSTNEIKCSNYLHCSNNNNNSNYVSNNNTNNTNNNTNNNCIYGRPTYDDNGCPLDCGEMQCQHECKKQLNCTIAPAGCHYESLLYDNFGCPFSCGLLKCQQCICDDDIPKKQNCHNFPDAITGPYFPCIQELGTNCGKWTNYGKCPQCQCRYCMKDREHKCANYKIKMTLEFDIGETIDMILEKIKIIANNLREEIQTGEIVATGTMLELSVGLIGDGAQERESALQLADKFQSSDALLINSLEIIPIEIELPVDSSSFTISTSSDDNTNELNNTNSDSALTFTEGDMDNDESASGCRLIPF